jgi:hypothetical protein
MSSRVPVLLAGALVAALAVPPAAAAERPKPAKVRLKAFRSCTGLVDYARRNALRNADALITPALPRTPAPTPVTGGGEDGGGAPPPAAAPPSAPVEAEDHSGTNVQEAGVDEPDIVKTDGSRLFAIAGNALHAIDVRDATPVRRGSLAIDPAAFEHNLLLRGDRLLLISRIETGLIEYDQMSTVPPPVGEPKTRLTEVDVSDPARMRVVRTLDVEGGYVSARLTGDTARVVISSPPRALDTSVRQVQRAPIGAWMPHATLTRRGRASQRVRRLVPCRSVRRPAGFSGLDMVTVLTIDLARGLPAVDADAVMTDAETVYGSPSSLYVATQRWIDPQTVATGEPPDRMHTAIHRFDASEAGRTAYRSTGQVPGFLLSQWAMSEHDGHLRVASTQAPDWWGGTVRESESHVTVLREDGGRLVAVGSVGGLGHGERIFAVRFIDDVGYVVTFRQTDPLYTVDVSTPTAPRVLGELKVRGYSAYLHPVGDGLLLGVGQDATAQGQTLGTQISLFDVSDPASPTRLHQRTLGQGASSAVEFDHRAFLYWPRTRLAVVPYEEWSQMGAGLSFGGAVGLQVGRAGGIAELGRVSHPVQVGLGAIRRSVVVRGSLLTVSDSGIMSSPLDTLRGGAWLAFQT